MKQAFTLIELLVVVLIIGILAAIALPGYQKAVEKSRMTQALTIANSLQKGMDAYLLEIGGPSAAPQLATGEIIGNLSTDPGGSKWTNANNFWSELESFDVRRIGNFAYAVRCETPSCLVRVVKFKEADDPNDAHTEEYRIQYTYSPTNGWTKSYTQQSAAKANLKPEFAALGFTTN